MCLRKGWQCCSIPGPSLRRYRWWIFILIHHCLDLSPFFLSSISRPCQGCIQQTARCSRFYHIVERGTSWTMVCCGIVACYCIVVLLGISRACAHLLKCVNPGL